MKTLRRITVALTKGGVGKTTTAAHVAHGLALRGKKILLVDCDTQGQSGVFFGIKPEVGLAHLITGKASRADAIVQARQNVDLLAGGFELVAVKRDIDRKDTGGELTLRGVLEPLEGEYDFIILDTAPGYDALSVSALFYANEVIIPVSLAALSVKGLLDFAQRLRGMGRGKRISRLWVVPTLFNDQVQQRKAIHQLLQTHFAKQLCPPIHSDIAVLEASMHGTTVFEHANRSKVATDYNKLIDFIVFSPEDEHDNQ